MTELLVKKFEGGVKVYPMLSQKKRYRLGLYHLESHHAKFQSISMKIGRVINNLEFMWWWWVVDSFALLITSENDFRLSEAVTIKFSFCIELIKFLKQVQL